MKRALRLQAWYYSKHIDSYCHAYFSMPKNRQAMDRIYSLLNLNQGTDLPTTFSEQSYISDFKQTFLKFTDFVFF